MADRLAKRLSEWLIDRLVTPEGLVLSWIGPSNSSYAYPEAAGLLLALLADERQPSARRVAARIAGSLSEHLGNRGSVGRDGQFYAFDSAIALRGLLAFVSAGGSLCDPDVPHRCFESLVQSVRDERATATPPKDPRRWSNTFSCHLLKLAFALTAYGEHYRESAGAEISVGLVDKLIGYRDGGRFRTAPNDARTYVHAHCYAVEGLLCLRARGVVDDTATIEACVAWLAEIQHKDGGIPSWHDGRNACGPCHADATAQAARIWCCVDRDRWAGAISRALAWIEMYTVPTGGVRYSDASLDQNSWTTMMSVQALRFAGGAAAPLDIV